VRINGRRINNRVQHILGRGDTVLVRTPGGGGYGPPAERPAALKQRDRTLGYVEGRAAGPPRR